MKMSIKHYLWIALIGLPLLLTGCASQDGPPTRPFDPSNVADANPKDEPHSRGGNKNYTVFRKHYKVLSTSKGYRQQGLASWYGRKWHGRRTANGEVYNMYGMTAAHKHLPLPTYAKVTNLDTGKSIVVRINDRGPFVGNRIIDLSYSAASKLGVVNRGLAHVEVEAINPSAARQHHAANKPKANAASKSKASAPTKSNVPAKTKTTAPAKAKKSAAKKHPRARSNAKKRVIPQHRKNTPAKQVVASAEGA